MHYPSLLNTWEIIVRILHAQGRVGLPLHYTPESRLNDIISSISSSDLPVDGDWLQSEVSSEASLNINHQEQVLSIFLCQYLNERILSFVASIC